MRCLLASSALTVRKSLFDKLGELPPKALRPDIRKLTDGVVTVQDVRVGGAPMRGLARNLIMI